MVPRRLEDRLRLEPRREPGSLCDERRRLRGHPTHEQPGVRWGPGLVARRLEARLRERPRRKRGCVRDESRRDRARETDQEPGVRWVHRLEASVTEGYAGGCMVEMRWFYLPSYGMAFLVAACGGSTQPHPPPPAVASVDVTPAPAGVVIGQTL